MILGHRFDPNNTTIHPLIQTILQELQSLQKEDFPLEKRILDADGLYINFASTNTAPAEERCFEAHRAYVDVHYIVAGTERIDVGNVSAMMVCKPYDAQEDFSLYEGPYHSSSTLKEGDFMICFPEDVHRVLVAPTTPQPICKAIVKIPLDRFKLKK